MNVRKTGQSTSLIHPQRYYPKYLNRRRLHLIYFHLNEPVDPNLCQLRYHKFAFTDTFWWEHPFQLTMDPLDTDLRLILEYPLIVKYQESNRVVYKGVISVGLEEYPVEVQQKPHNQLDYTLPPQLHEFSSQITETLQHKTTKTVLDVLSTFEFFMKKHTSSKCVNRCSLYEKILTEFKDLTKFYLNLKTSSLAYDLSRINLSMLDERNREHFMVVLVSETEKDIFSIFTYDLPYDNFKPNSNLKDLYIQFVEVVDKLQPFFDLMEVFDSNCCILDPVPALKKFIHRRIYLQEKLSMIVTVDPFNVSQIPDIKFLGPENLVSTYRARFNENLEDWACSDVMQNLLQILGMDSFPQRHQIDSDRESILISAGDCCICFSQRLDNELPSIVCKNESCATCYHTQCLYEWLTSVSSKRFFNEIIGNCLNCEKSISCPIPS